MMLNPESATIMSGLPSPFRSPVLTALGVDNAGDCANGLGCARLTVGPTLKPPAPSPNNTVIVALPLLATARSRLLSPSMSLVETEIGLAPAAKAIGLLPPGVNVPLPLPSKMETLSLSMLDTAMSR